MLNAWGDAHLPILLGIVAIATTAPGALAPPAAQIGFLVPRLAAVTLLEPRTTREA